MTGAAAVCLLAVLAAAAFSDAALTRQEGVDHLTLPPIPLFAFVLYYERTRATAADVSAIRQ